MYYYDINDKTLSLIEENLDNTYCILKILKIQFNTFHYIITTDTKGYVNFWDITNYIENNKEESTSATKYTHHLHQSGINCCDWLELQNMNSLLATGGDDQSLKLSIFDYKDTFTLLCNVSISVHCSQVTGNFYLFIIIISFFVNVIVSMFFLGIKLFKNLVISASVDQKICFCSWSFDLNCRTIKVLPLTSYFTTVADIHGLIAQKVG